AARSPSLGAGLETAGALSLAVSLALANASLFFFVPEGEIRRVPGDLEPLSHVTGRVLTPPMSELAYRALQPGLFGTETIRRQRESLLGYTNLLAGVATVRTAAPLPTRGAHAIADAIDQAEEPVRAAGPACSGPPSAPFGSPRRRSTTSTEPRSLRTARASRSFEGIGSSRIRSARGAPSPVVRSI